MQKLPKDAHNLIFENLDKSYLFMLSLTCMTFRKAPTETLTKENVGIFCGNGNTNILLFLEQMFNWQFNEEFYIAQAMDNQKTLEWLACNLIANEYHFLFFYMGT